MKQKLKQFGIPFLIIIISEVILNFIFRKNEDAIIRIGYLYAFTYSAYIWVSIKKIFPKRPQAVVEEKPSFDVRQYLRKYIIDFPDF